MCKKKKKKNESVYEPKSLYAFLYIQSWLVLAEFSLNDHFHDYLQRLENESECFKHLKLQLIHIKLCVILELCVEADISTNVKITSIVH